MSTASLTAVVIGASGAVGQGVVRAYLDAGARVVAVGRSRERLDAALRTIQADKDPRAVAVEGAFDTEEHAAAARDAVLRALGAAAAAVDHVVSAQGFADIGPPLTRTALADLQLTLENGLFNNFLAAKAFVPMLKARPGATFTLVSGGLAHASYHESQWRATIKNAAINAMTYGLAKETEHDEVRVNTVCIHFSVGPVEGGAPHTPRHGRAARARTDARRSQRRRTSSGCRPSARRCRWGRRSWGSPRTPPSAASCCVWAAGPTSTRWPPSRGWRSARERVESLRGRACSLRRAEAQRVDGLPAQSHSNRTSSLAVHPVSSVSTINPTVPSRCTPVPALGEG